MLNAQTVTFYASFQKLGHDPSAVKIDVVEISTSSLV